MNLSLSHVHTRLRDYRHQSIQTISLTNDDDAVNDSLRRAGVAILLRFQRDTPDVLLMKRVVHVHDHWSGHVSLPGGKAHQATEQPFDVAIRETYEEVGLDLRAMSQYLGPIDEIQAMGRGKPLAMVISPFVFVQLHEAPLSLNEEAEAAFWLPLDRVVSGSLNASFRYESRETGLLHLPCWNYQEYTIWGLTYKMIHRFLEVIK